MKSLPEHGKSYEIGICPTSVKFVMA
jgi:hypothetical protein